ncbi:MAG: single-stranded-DNA-specific exonuclease RecJ, partial [bacterium]
MSKINALVKKWQVAEVDGVLAEDLSLKFGLPLAVAKVLILRGLTASDKIDHFLHPRLSAISDPFRMPGMTDAVDRIWRALDAGERIAIFGDYDADGITSTALIVQVLRLLGGSVEPCLPNRMTEGYGLTVAGIDRCIRTLDPRLIITVDCGSNSAEAIAIAAQRKIDVVVTDHHEIQQSGAAPVALVNPHLSPDEDVKGLAGVGVAFKVCHALLKRGRDSGNAASGKVDLRRLLDLVAIGTVADIAPLRGENRILVWNGIMRLRETSNTGMCTLLDTLALPRESIDTYHLGYVVGPRFNAAGRLGSPESVLELLLTADAERAAVLVRDLEAVNQRRISVERETSDKARQEANRLFNPEKDQCVVVGMDDLHIGVIGLAASRLCREYARPALVIAFGEDGVGKGSGRSVPGFDLVAGLGECAGTLEGFGGHTAAAGFTVLREKFDEFRNRFQEVCRSRLSAVDLQPIQHV